MNYHSLSLIPKTRKDEFRIKKKTIKKKQKVIHTGKRGKKKKTLKRWRRARERAKEKRRKKAQETMKQHRARIKWSRVLFKKFPERSQRPQTRSLEKYLFRESIVQKITSNKKNRKKH